MSDPTRMTEITPIIWDEAYLPPIGRQAELEAVVRRDVETLDLDKPSDLIFHHVEVGEGGLEGPVVFVFGVNGSDALHCRYDADPQWEIIEPPSLEGRAS